MILSKGKRLKKKKVVTEEKFDTLDHIKLRTSVPQKSHKEDKKASQRIKRHSCHIKSTKY